MECAILNLASTISTVHHDFEHQRSLRTSFRCWILRSDQLERGPSERRLRRRSPKLPRRWPWGPTCRPGDGTFGVRRVGVWGSWAGGVLRRRHPRVWHRGVKRPGFSRTSARLTLSEAAEKTTSRTGLWRTRRHASLPHNPSPGHRGCSECLWDKKKDTRRRLWRPVWNKGGGMRDSGEFGESKEPSASPRNPVEAAARGGGGGGFSVFFHVHSGPGTPATDPAPVYEASRGVQLYTATPPERGLVHTELTWLRDALFHASCKRGKNGHAH